MKVGTGGLTGSSTPVQAELITLRYYFNAELGPTSLKLALEKTKGVDKVVLDAANRTAQVTYSGALKTIPVLEQAAAASGVPAAIISHARLIVGFKALKGADLAKLQQELQGVSGVKSAKVQGTTAELFADLATLTNDSLKQASANANFEMLINSHEYVTLKLSNGDAQNLSKDLTATKGVLVLKSASGDSAEMWTVKKIGDDTFKKLVEKAGAAIGEILRK